MLSTLKKCPHSLWAAHPAFSNAGKQHKDNYNPIINVTSSCGVWAPCSPACRLSVSTDVSSCNNLGNLSASLSTLSPPCPAEEQQQHLPSLSGQGQTWWNLKYNIICFIIFRGGQGKGCEIFQRENWKTPFRCYAQGLYMYLKWSACYDSARFFPDRSSLFFWEGGGVSNLYNIP